MPAANEAATIGRCLRTLLADARPGEFEVVVVCNGCTDPTADIARATAARFPSAVQILETPVASKPHALNLGDAAASTFPRVYLDADVQLTTVALRAVVAPLLAGEVEASAPGVHLDVEVASRGVRAYHRVWSALPQVRDGLGGRGVYAVSEVGHARFGSFPDVLGDDLFVDWSFPPERRAVVDACSVVTAEATLAELVHRKSRVFAGIAEQRQEGGSAPGATGIRALLATLRERPALLASAPVYVAANLEARRRARRRGRRRTSPAAPVWERAR